jgi:hypothetical protein
MLSSVVGDFDYLSEIRRVLRFDVRIYGANNSELRVTCASNVRLTNGVLDAKSIKLCLC